MIGAKKRNYPRSRGEKITCTVEKFGRKELPPLARGKVLKLDIWYFITGITPARAGKRNANEAGQQINRNYPRSRGEKLGCGGAVGVVVELPPLARGKVGQRRGAVVVVGITPARAGKSKS